MLRLWGSKFAGKSKAERFFGKVTKKETFSENKALARVNACHLRVNGYEKVVSIWDPLYMGVSNRDPGVSIWGY